MTVRVRMTARRSHFARRLVRRATALLGGLLLLVGATVGMLIVLIPVVILMGVMGGEDLSAGDRAIMAQLGRGWLLAVAITITGCATGAALLRSRRGMVLWLRRFRDAGAIRVVSSALDHIGRSWRVVTLDDAHAPSVGVASSLRISTRVFSAISAAVKRIGPAVPVIGRFVTTVCVIVLVVAVGWSIYQGTIFDLLAAFPAYGSGSLEAQAVTVAVIVLGVEFGLLLAYIAVMFALIPLMGFFTLAGNVLDEIRSAELEKDRSIRTVEEARSAATAAASSSGKVIAPRLSVLTVDDAVWRETVLAVAARSNAVLIDVSEISDHVAWEVAQVDRLPETSAVFVADRERVDPERLAPLLGSSDVLLYGTGPVGRWRFQRALFNELESTLPASGLGLPGLRRVASVAAGLIVFLVSSRIGLAMIAAL